MFKPSDVIAEVRGLINDDEAGQYRQSDIELLRYFNEGLKEASTIAPTWFISTGDFTCKPEQTEQAVTFDDAQALYEVIRIKDGRALLRMDMKTLSQFNPDWAAEDPAPALNWDKNDADPLRFYIYPKAPVGMQLLEVSYIRNPAIYALNDDVTEVPSSYMPAFVNYVTFRAESKDDESVNVGRSNAFYANFKMQLTGNIPKQEGAA